MGLARLHEPGRYPVTRLLLGDVRRDGLGPSDLDEAPPGGRL